MTSSLDTAPLAAAFRDMTASYKAFWFLALVEAVNAQGGVGDRPSVTYDEMRDRMLAAAFWPAVRYRLSFGQSDRLHERLALLRRDEGGEVLPVMRDERSRGVLRYVPGRFLASWLAQELAAVPQSGRDKAIVGLADVAFGTPGRIPYRLAKAGVEIDPLWRDHLREHVAVMRALGERELIRFLQSRNPTVPGIPDKIAEARRGSLAGQASYWREAVDALGLRCFYTGEPMAGEFSLDHFVPWSFVVHDRIWNLVPARRSVNSSKGLRLPDEAYVDRLGSFHLAAVRHAMRRDPGFAAKGVGADYEMDLGIRLDRASDEEILGAHRDTVVPLLGLARRSGYPATWRWPAATTA